MAACLALGRIPALVSLALVVAASFEVGRRRRLPNRRRAALAVLRGGERDNFLFGGSSGGLDEKWYSDVRSRPNARDSSSVAAEPLAMDAANGLFGAIIEKGTLRAAAAAASVLATLMATMAWLRSRGSRSSGGAEKAYADSVAALEAQLHRLSVDRQMLADEFAEARKSLEAQIASVTAGAETSRAEMAAALDRAEREASTTRAELSAVAARLEAELKTSEQLRQDKARQQIELDALQAAARRPAPSLYEDAYDDFRRQQRYRELDDPRLRPTQTKKPSAKKKKKSRTKAKSNEALVRQEMSAPPVPYLLSRRLPTFVASSSLHVTRSPRMVAIAEIRLPCPSFFTD